MQRRYYLSKFIGTGKTPTSSFKPKVSLYGNKWGIVDLRQDETSSAGWCIACLDCDNHSPLESDTDVIDLGTDAHASLSEDKKLQIQNAIGIPLWSKSIADLLMEICLGTRDLQPSLDGKYQIYCGGLLKDLSEDEAMEFIGNIVSANDPPSIPFDRTKKLGSRLKTSLEAIRNLVCYKDPTWLERQLRSSKLNHPLAINYPKASEALTKGEDAIWSSHASNWIMMLVSNIDVVADKLNTERLAGRLCSLNDCEPTVFELYVMAAYEAAGAMVETTDNNKTGEFRVIHAGIPVYVECKKKTAASLKDRAVIDIYAKGTESLKEFMKQNNVFAQILVTLSSDPEEADLKSLLEVIRQELLSHPGQLRQLRKGKNEIVLMPTFGESPMLTTPKGYDYASSEGQASINKDGQKVLRDVRGVAWYSLTPTNWVSSALDSLKKAANQLPKDSPALVYLEIPFGPYEVVVGRLFWLSRKLQPYLETRKGVNAVILIGQAWRTNPSSPGTAIITYRYNTLFQKNPRTPLPDGFKVFGNHYTWLGR